MSYIYAALILHETGKEITPEGIVSILKAAGMSEIDESFAKAVASALAKVDIEEVKSKALFAPVAAPAAPAAEAAPAEEKKEEEKKEEKKEEEKKEEESLAGLAALFG